MRMGTPPLIYLLRLSVHTRARGAPPGAMGNGASTLADVADELASGDVSRFDDDAWDALLSRADASELTPGEIRAALTDSLLREARLHRPENLLTLAVKAVERAEAAIEPDEGDERRGAVCLPRDAGVVLGAIRILARVFPYVACVETGADEPADARALHDATWGDATRAPAAPWRTARALVVPAPASPSASTAGRSAGPQPLGARVCSLVVDLLHCPGFTAPFRPPPPPDAITDGPPIAWDPPAPRADPDLATRRAETLRLLLALVAAEAMYTPPPREAAAPTLRRRFLDRFAGGVVSSGVPAGRALTHADVFELLRGSIADAPEGAATAATPAGEQLACAMHCLLTLLDYDPPEEEGDGDDARDPRTAGGGAEVAGGPAAERGLFSIVDDLFGGLWGGLDGALGLPRPKDKDAAGGTAAAAAGRGGPGGSRHPRDPSPRERLSRASRRPPPASFADSFSWFGGLEDRLGVASRGPGGGGRAPSSGGRFLPAAAFAGARRGYYFRLGDRGLGYYPDPNADAAGADSESVAVASPGGARAFGPEPRPEEGRTLAASDVGPDAFDDDDDDARVRSAGANPFAASLDGADPAPLHDALLSVIRSGLPSVAGEARGWLASGLGALLLGDDAGVLDASRLSCFEEAAALATHCLRSARFRERATSAEARGGLPLAFALLALVTRHAGDPNKGGFAQCAVFSIVQLSSDANFASSLAASCSPRWIPELELARDFRGSHADALVLCSRRLLLEAPPAWVAPLANPLLTTLHNVAPWFRRLNRDAASALLEMAAFHARPETLFAQPGERRNDRVKELALTVSPIDRCLRHAAEENPELIAAVCDERGAVLDRLDAFGPRATRNDDEIGDFREEGAAADDGEGAEETGRSLTPSAEWLRAIHGELPLASATALRSEARRRRDDEGSGGRARAVSPGEARRLLGAAPGRARARRFAGDSREIRRWLRGYALGLVLLRQQSGTAAAVFAPLFDAERIRLFRVVEIGRGE